MEALLSLLQEHTVYNFLLLFARILAFMAFMPIFSHSSVNSQIRVALSFFLTVFLFPIVTITNDPMSEQEFIVGIIKELVLGLVASFLVNIVFFSVKIIGDFVGYATALSMSNMFDPTTGSQEGIISRFLHLIALMIFFESGLYEITIVLLVKSFDMVNLGGFDLFSFDGIKIAIEEIKRMFSFALAFALPLFFIGFIMDVYYGYGTKSMPAFSPFVITFQMKFVLIFLFMMLGLDVFSENFVEYFTQKFS